MKHLKFTAELTLEDEGGFSVYCPELGIASQGDSEEEALANMKEAAELHLETLKELGELGVAVRQRKTIRREIEVAADV